MSAPREERRVPIGGRLVKEIRCCGAWLTCAGFTNTCPTCHTDYNSAGQQLAPREQWGEETGETANDVLLAEAAGWPDLEE